MIGISVTERALNAGRLRGNAFRLRVRCDDAQDQSLKRFAADPRCLNVFGPQRVGRDDANEGTPPATWKIGRALLQGDAAEAFRVVCASALSDFATNAALRDVVQGISTDNFARAASKKLSNALPRSSPARDVAQAYVRTGDAAKAVKAAPHAARTMWAHAYQAFLFNKGAARRRGALIEQERLVRVRPQRPRGVRRSFDCLGGVAGAHVGLGHVPGRRAPRQRVGELLRGSSSEIISCDALDDVP